MGYLLLQAHTVGVSRGHRSLYLCIHIDWHKPVWHTTSRFCFCSSHRAIIGCLNEPHRLRNAPPMALDCFIHGLLDQDHSCVDLLLGPILQWLRSSIRHTL